MSRYRDSCPLDCKVYVGDLGNSGTKHEIEEAFSYYGPLRSVWVARNPPGFAFVEFEDTRDARDASRALDGKILCGRRVRVELSTGKSRHNFRGPPPRPFHPEDRCYDCGERGHYARDCKRVSRRYRSGGSSSRSRRSRSRSRSHARSASRSHSRSRSRSRSPRGGSHSRSQSGSRASHSPKDRRSPSRSPRNSPADRNGDVN